MAMRTTGRMTGKNDAGQDKHIFVCADEETGILSAIYDAFSYISVSRTHRAGIIISKGSSYDAELFCEYEEIKSDGIKVEKVLSGIYNKLGQDIYASVLQALCHYSPARADIIFRFLRTAFREGKKAINMQGMPEVMRFFEISRKAANEAHLFLGFVRFDEIRGILYSEIEPECNVLPLIAEHFADRFPHESFIILDKKRDYGVLHGSGGMIMASGAEIVRFIMPDDKRGECTDAGCNECTGGGLPGDYDEYSGLWKVFFDNIMIGERANYVCQRNLVPLWMRKHMNEFKESPAKNHDGC